MLFSNPSLANFINSNFEPAWESVRPVPVVRIDFGQGNVVTRTLNGNIATYICTADGQVLDVLPGIYDATTYLQQLQQLQLLHRLSQTTLGLQEVLNYHRTQSEQLRKGESVQVLRAVSQGASITGRELGVRIVLEPAARLRRRARAVGHAAIATVELGADEQRQLLTEDSHINETVRRQLVHDYLAAHPQATPASMKKWLYKEVLKADLDDPYLGLGPLLQ